MTSHQHSTTGSLETKLFIRKMYLVNLRQIIMSRRDSASMPALILIELDDEAEVRRMKPKNRPDKF